MHIVTPSSLTSLSALLVSAAIIVIILRRRSLQTIHRLLVLYCVSVCIWALGRFITINAGLWFGLSDNSPHAQVYPYIFSVIIFIGISTVASHWFLVGAAYSRKVEWLERPRLWVAYAPLIWSLVFVITNPAHHLFFRQLSLNSFEFGPAHVIWTSMMFALMLFPIVWYMGVASQMKDAAYRRQAVVMAMASVVHLVGGNLFAFSRVTGISFPLGYTFAAQTLSSAMLCYALLRMGWLDILPIALKEVFNSTPDPILILNTDRKLVEANRAATLLLPLMRAGDPVELPGAHIPGIVHPGNNEPLPDSGTELRLGDSVYWVRSLSITHKVETAGFLLILTDITLRKRAEDEKERLIGQLKEIGARLQESNRELESFAFRASHDLQEPLRKILLFSDRLRGKYGEQIGEQGRDYLERMQNAAARMQGLIDGLLTLSRVTSSAQPPVPVNLSEAAKEALSDLEPRIEQSGGQVQIEDLPTIDGDPLQLRLLMQNLIGNGVKFRAPGRPPIVRVYSLAEQGQDDESQKSSLGGCKYCRIAVQDNGIGFDERHADRIFGVFERLQSRSEYDGTGIGLATCRKIAERHGGSITATSKPGLGSEFVVTLPVHRFA
jgi:signal transduction histidine kinase